MKKNRMMLCAMIAGGMIGGGWTVAGAQLTQVRPADATSERPEWFAEAEGWQVGVWGAPGDHRWRIGSDGRGSITIQGRPRTGGARLVERPFTLTAAEHQHFAALIQRFTATPQNVDVCMTDQAQDIIRWQGGTLGAGLFNFDHGCRDAANAARLALLTEALAILRNAAAREAQG